MGVKFRFVDLGGGLGVCYEHAGQPAPGFDEYANAVMPEILATFSRLGVSPELWIEPGRSMVCDSTILLTKVNSVKKAHKVFVNVDAGFNTLIRPAMYDSYHEVIVADKAAEKPAGIFTVTGPICETGDILAHDRELPEVESGDLIAVLDTGAYGYAMASQYNGRGRCAEVLVNGDRSALMRRAETYEDLLSAVVTPPWL
jgi:diaminopimelate decarboxylase